MRTHTLVISVVCLWNCATTPRTMSIRLTHTLHRRTGTDWEKSLLLRGVQFRSVAIFFCKKKVATIWVEFCANPFLFFLFADRDASIRPIVHQIRTHPSPLRDTLTAPAAVNLLSPHQKFVLAVRQNRTRRLYLATLQKYAITPILSLCGSPCRSRTQRSKLFPFIGTNIISSVCKV